jgi:hypothetical protein
LVRDWRCTGELDERLDLVTPDEVAALRQHDPSWFIAVDSGGGRIPVGKGIVDAGRATSAGGDVLEQAPQLLVVEGGETGRRRAEEAALVDSRGKDTVEDLAFLRLGGGAQWGEKRILALGRCRGFSDRPPSRRGRRSGIPA